MNTVIFGDNKVPAVLQPKKNPTKKKLESEETEELYLSNVTQRKVECVKAGGKIPSQSNQYRYQF